LDLLFPISEYYFESQGKKKNSPKRKQLKRKLEFNRNQNFQNSALFFTFFDFHFVQKKKKKTLSFRMSFSITFFLYILCCFVKQSTSVDIAIPGIHFIVFALIFQSIREKNIKNVTKKSLFWKIPNLKQTEKKILIIYLFIIANVKQDNSIQFQFFFFFFRPKRAVRFGNKIFTGFLGSYTRTSQRHIYGNSTSI